MSEFTVICSCVEIDIGKSSVRTLRGDSPLMGPTATAQQLGKYHGLRDSNYENAEVSVRQYRYL